MQMQKSHISEVNRIKSMRRQLNLNPLRVFAEQLRLHGEAGRLHVQHQWRGLPRDRAHHVKIGLTGLLARV